MTLDSYVTFPGCGLRVSPLTLGTMSFGQDWGRGAPPEDAEAIIDRYRDLGGNSIDTANIYTNGHAEAIVGDWIAAHPDQRDRIVLGTKFFGNLHVGDPNGGGGSRKAIILQLEESLRRLRTDWIDIYWIHNLDTGTPIEETLRALDDLVRDGRIRYIGISDFPAWKTAQAHTVAAFRDWTPAVALQLEYSLIERTSEGEQIPMARDLGLAVMPWSPLGGGLLTGKYRQPQTDGRLSGTLNPAHDHIVSTLIELASGSGISPAAAALAWVRGRPGITSTVIGPRTLEQLEQNLQSLDVLPHDLEELTAASQPQLPFPHDNNRSVVPLVQYAGATVDGTTYPVLPGLLDSTTRY